MKVLNSKLMSFEEEAVEYFSEEEYKADLDIRRKSGWTQIRVPDFELKSMKLLRKSTNKGFVIRYKRYNGVRI